MNIAAEQQRLVWLESSTGQCVPLRGHVSLGRSRANTIPINCDKASRRHAIIRQDEEGRCHLIDLGSSNGTYVNGARITHLTPLDIGDSFEIGSERFTLRALAGGTQMELDPEPSTSAQLVPCWMIIGDKEHPGSESGEGDCSDNYKTTMSWAQAACQILVRNKASIPAGFEERIFAYWRDPARDPSVAAAVANALNELRVAQARQRLEFRLALHVGTVVIGTPDPRRNKALIGTEVTFAFHMQRLAWVLSVPCLLSEEANRRLAPLLATRALEPCGLYSDQGDRQFFTL